MTEEIRYIANLQRQEEFDNEVTELKDALKRLEQENKELKEKYSHVLELAKTNADSNEYCLQELEKENEQLRSALEEIREIANENNFCASYACPPMFKILDKINEVLND